jgi:hypothetical protein
MRLLASVGRRRSEGVGRKASVRKASVRKASVGRASVGRAWVVEKPYPG